MSAEVGIDPNITYSKAVFVCDFRWREEFPSGIPVVEHTRLYFLGSDDQWYGTEFAGDFPDKSTANIIWYDNKKQTDEIHSIMAGDKINGINYVINI